MPGRVCIVRHGYFPMDVRVRRETSALVAAGFEVDIVCLRLPGQPWRESVDGATIYRVPVSHRRGSQRQYIARYAASLLLCALTASALHLWRRYDIVQINTMPDLMVCAGLIPKLLGARIVLDIHDLMPELYISKFGATRHSLLTRLIILQEGASIALADLVITATEEFRRILIGRHGREDIAVIMNCPDASILPRRAPSSVARALASRGDTRFVLVSHGVIVERLGYDTAIQAVARLRQDIPGIELRIIGAGEYTTVLERLAADLGVSAHVHFLGYAPLDLIPDLVADADLGIVANKRDGFADLLLPTKLLEYAWLGKPAVVSRTPTIVRYFDDSMVSYFTPGDADELADRILTLYRHPDQRLALATNASRFFHRYSWDKEKARYRDLLLDLLKPGQELNRGTGSIGQEQPPGTPGLLKG